MSYPNTIEGCHAEIAHGRVALEEAEQAYNAQLNVSVEQRRELEDLRAKAQDLESQLAASRPSR